MSETINFMPEQGDISTLFERLDNYITPVNSAWCLLIEGASEEKIETLRKVSKIDEMGWDFPEAYQMFLRHMGEDDCDLLKNNLLRADFCVDEVIECYELCLEGEMERKDCLLIANFETGDKLYLDLRFKDREPRVFFNFFNRKSSTFENFLFQSAFKMCEFQRFKHLELFGGSTITHKKALEKGGVTDIFQVVESFARREGFIKAWFSDMDFFVAYRKDAAFMVQRPSFTKGDILFLDSEPEEPGDGGLTMILCGNDALLMEQYGGEFSQAIGVSSSYGMM